MQFYRIPYGHYPPRGMSFPSIVLVKDNWNDFGYRTLFKLYIHKDYQTRIEVGYVKILDGDQQDTSLPSEFERLDENYCSLGHSTSYYVDLKSELPDRFEEILLALRDSAFDDQIRNIFQDKEGFQKSLLRDSDQERALNQAKDVILGNSSAFNTSFTYDCQLEGATTPHSIDFDFNAIRDDLPHRVFCLIGKNGTGKTQYLAKLAMGMSGESPELKVNFHPGRPLFSRVLSVSYSMFDSFQQPKSVGRFSYFYFGFKDNLGHLLPSADIQNRLIRSLRKIVSSERTKEQWFSLLENTIDIHRLRTLVDSRELADDFDLYQELRVSSGQGIILDFVTNILANITDGSLVIFDEPEMHLHPNGISQMVKILYDLLEQTGSFGIIATHSPMIVQQIPSKYIRVIDRIGDAPLVRRLEHETFGENLTAINSYIFENLSEEEYYKIVLRRARKYYRPEAIDEFFDGNLSLNARLYIENNRS